MSLPLLLLLALGPGLEDEAAGEDADADEGEDGIRGPPRGDKPLRRLPLEEEELPMPTFLCLCLMCIDGGDR